MKNPSSHFIPVVTGEITKRSKIIELNQLPMILDGLRNAGKSIIHCHGVFDLLHIGHIRHLAEAKSLGDILVVSITEDQHVHKGPHRPAFSEHLRTEALAALEHIDYVTISRFPTAIEAITTIRPNLYVKGPDYRENSADITGGIALEEQAVQSLGGRVHYTDDISFSSSHLINRFFSPFTTSVEGYLNQLRSEYSKQDLLQYLEKMQTMKVGVVGEAILDEYVYCDQMGKSAKDPVLVMRYDSNQFFAGGALAVANHLADFVQEVELITYIGDTDSHEAFIRKSLKKNVTPHFIVKRDSPTIVKRRYVERYLKSKHFEVYYINDEPIDTKAEQGFCALIEGRFPQLDVVIAADFGHGLITTTAMKHLAALKPFFAVNTQINAGNIRYHAISTYERADYICINESEIRLDARSRNGQLADLVANLSKRLACDKILVTRGSAGASYFEHGIEYKSPAFTSTVIDRTGSGDAVLAISSVAVASGMPAKMVAFLSNVIGAEKVQILGNSSSVERIATLKFIDALLK